MQGTLQVKLDIDRLLEAGYLKKQDGKNIPVTNQERSSKGLPKLGELLTGLDQFDNPTVRLEYHKVDPSFFDAAFINRFVVEASWFGAMPATPPRNMGLYIRTTPVGSARAYVDAHEQRPDLLAIRIFADSYQAILVLYHELRSGLIIPEKYADWGQKSPVD
jgi:hypothetical protein